MVVVALIIVITDAHSDPGAVSSGFLLLHEFDLYIGLICRRYQANR